MEETPLGNKHLFSLEISIPKSHLPSLMCLTHNKIKTNIPQQFSLLALFTVTCHLTPCPQKWAVIAHLCTDRDLRARHGPTSAGTVQWEQPY